MRIIVLVSLTAVFLLTVIQCTTPRWSVKDLQSIETQSDSELISSKFQIISDGEITPENPFLELNLYRIDERSFDRRVLVERTLQYYRPRWGFMAIAALGAGFAFYAASSDAFAGSPSGQKSLALNSAGVLLSLLAVTNIEPSGEPVRTGESRFLRTSGTELIPDTVSVSESDQVGHRFELEVHYEGELLSTRLFSANGEREWAVRLPDLFRDRDITGTEPGAIVITLRQNGEKKSKRIELSSFLRPVVVVTAPVGELRAAPEFDDSDPFTMLGSGSELELIGEYSDAWYEVRFGGSTLYLSHESGEIRWQGADTVSQPSLVPVDDVPFGEISVEFSIPVLKSSENSDAAVLISNHRANRLGIRRHMERDLRLVETYFRDALQVTPPAIEQIHLSEESQVPLPEMNLDEESILYIYMSGFAQAGLEDGPRIELLRLDNEGREYRQDLGEFFRRLADSGAGRVVVFADLEFQHGYGDEFGSNGMSLFRQIAEELISGLDRSAVIFASRPDQASGLYESLRFEMKYHHIFPYYLAQGLQQRRTRLSTLVQHMESQVDYTSRRLHDRPQSILSFGDLTIDLRD